MPSTGDAHRQGHRRRLRERFLQNGLGGFHDYEVVELLLTLATPRKDCKAAAKAALGRFGTLQGVLSASPAELSAVPGIGPANQFGLRLVRAVAQRYLEHRVQSRNPVRNSKEFFDFLYGTLRDLPREHFVGCFLDAKNCVLATRTLFTGTLTAGAVYPREVVQAALEHRAAALIVAHNHPSGDPAPSAEDIAITRHLVFACRVMGISLHEHLIIGQNRYFSFADQGHMARFNRDYDAQMAAGPEVI